MANPNRIQPYPQNPFYWQYKGQPVVLLGGTVEDNLFQIPNLIEHLDLLASVSGNYVRCTMSSRDEGDVWPFERDSKTGLYDLNQPGEAYWQRFENFLKLTAKRDIIAQFELWDRFDFARAPWQDNPYNPKNNLNYTAEESGLKKVINTHPGRRESNFFHTVPALKNNTLLLAYQQSQVDTMLSISLNYNHVLYCMDNETNDSPEWSWYWAKYIQAKAEAAGTEVEMTEMWDDHNLLGAEHAHTFDHPELFSFIDISQNNHRSANEHWANPQAVRQKIIESGHIRPMNSVKIYGANSGRYGSTRDAQERLWRNIFGGLASSRFHRPPSGLGLSQISQAHLKSLRMVLDEIDIFTCEPRLHLVENRSWNETYCTANPGTEYALFFPDGGNVQLNVSEVGQKPLKVRWLDIRHSDWLAESGPMQATADGWIQLITPQEEGYWAVVVKAL